MIAEKKAFFLLLQTSCTLRALLRLQFNLNETRYFVLIMFIEELLKMQYLLFSFWVCTRINRKVFQRVSMPPIVVHVRGINFSPLTCSDVLVLCCWSLQKRVTQYSKGISVGIIGMYGNSTSSPLNFPFKIVVSMIMFIIFFHLSLGHWSLGHWSLGQLVAW
jgi:hypothetical protein